LAGGPVSEPENKFPDIESEFPTEQEVLGCDFVIEGISCFLCAFCSRSFGLSDEEGHDLGKVRGISNSQIREYGGGKIYGG
jgi:hypothetical protein